MARAPVHPNVILATCCLSLFLTTMDVTIVNVALPSIRTALHASTSALQWSIDGYTVVVASFLMLAGSTADRLGRKRTFMTGLVLFALGSGLCSLAPTIEMLVAARVVQALGGAMLNPIAMSIITNTFVEPKARARAIGVWGAVVGLSMAVGPPLGGILTEHLGWRSIFWVNLPFAAIAIVLTWLHVTESKAEHARRVDPLGQVLVVLVLAALTSTLIEGPHAGWASPPILVGFVVAVSSLIGLISYERRRTEPLIDLRFFRSIPFAAATVIAVLAFLCFSAGLFLDSLYLQEARHLHAARAGLCMLPIAVSMAACSPISGRLVGAGRARVALVIAGCAIATSALMLTRLEVHTPMPYVMIAFAIFGVGAGIVNAPITNTAVSGMPRAQAGVASALASTSRQVGATLGVALAGALAVGGKDYSQSTHAVWWLVLGAGVLIATIGFLSTSAYAKRSAAALGPLLDPS